MKICASHWQVMRDAVEQKGLMGLVAKSGEAALDSQLRHLEEAQQAGGSISEKTLRDTFDPLMSMHWHFTNNALRCGGLAVMGQRDDGENDGHYCPVCLFEQNQPGFVATEEIGSVVDQMRDYCIEQGLVPKPA